MYSRALWCTFCVEYKKLIYVPTSVLFCFTWMLNQADNKLLSQNVSSLKMIGMILIKNSCHFVNLLCLQQLYFFLSLSLRFSSQVKQNGIDVDHHIGHILEKWFLTYSWAIWVTNTSFNNISFTSDVTCTP